MFDARLSEVIKCWSWTLIFLHSVLAWYFFEFTFLILSSQRWLDFGVSCLTLVSMEKFRNGGLVCLPLKGTLEQFGFEFCNMP